MLETLRLSVSRDVLACCGVPAQLVEPGAATGSREAWRRFVLSSCTGLAALVSAEIGAKLAPVAITFDALYGHDLVGRSQALGRLVKQAEMPLADARAVCGL